MDLDSLIDEATMDCYDEFECRMGFLASLEDNLQLPFEAKLGEMTVTVINVDGDDHTIKAFVKIDKSTFPVDILDLEIDQNIPGFEWVVAYRKWETGK